MCGPNLRLAVHEQTVGRIAPRGDEPRNYSSGSFLASATNRYPTFRTVSMNAWP